MLGLAIAGTKFGAGRPVVGEWWIETAAPGRFEDRTAAAAEGTPRRRLGKWGGGSTGGVAGRSIL